jgi:hypothetical protein
MNFQIMTSWRHIGDFELQGSEYQLKVPSGIPSLPGVYQIIALDPPDSMNQIYVGEGQNLLRRLNNYRNAGYEPLRLAATNRRVQGWIYEGISNNKCDFEIHICTEGIATDSNGLKINLDFSLKHSRMLVENLVRTTKSNLRFENV